MKKKRLEFNDNIYLIEVKADEEDLGVIIDIFNAKTKELIDTYTYWHDDLNQGVNK